MIKMKMKDIQFQKWGRSVKVYDVLVGNYKRIKESSYHRVYDDDGKFTYCKLAENITRKEGKYIG